MSASISAPDAVRRAVQAGRRRLGLQAVGQATGYGVACALAVVLLALLLGLDLVPLEAAWAAAPLGALWGYLEWRRRRPTSYEVAQLLDARWQAQDRIATAFYFDGRREDAGPYFELQQRQGAVAAAAGDVAKALPYRLSAALSAAAALAFAAAALLVVRLFFAPGLALEAPLIALTPPAATTVQEEAEPSLLQAAAEPPLASAEGEEELALRMAEAEPAPLADAEPEASAPQPPPFEMPEVEGLALGDESGDETAFDASEGAAEGAEGAPTADGEPPSDREAGDAAEQTAANNEEASGLLDRLREAFEDMLRSLGADQPQAGDEQRQAAQGGESGDSESSQGEGAEAQGEGGAQTADAQMEGGEQAEGAPQPNAEGQGQGDTSEGSQQAQAAGAAGSAEGSKDLARDAEAREAAFDAIEQFYLERSDEIRGEIVVEAEVAVQTAQTPFAPADREHADRGGAISRDDIPLAYQGFVQNYFRNLRSRDQN